MSKYSIFHSTFHSSETHLFLSFFLLSFFLSFFLSSLSPVQRHISFPIEEFAAAMNESASSQFNCVLSQAPTDSDTQRMAATTACIIAIARKPVAERCQRRRQCTSRSICDGRCRRRRGQRISTELEPVTFLIKMTYGIQEQKRYRSVIS